MDFEDILEEVGDFGYYQKKLCFFYVFVAAAILPLHCMTTIFMVSSPSHVCKVNQLSELTFGEQQQLISPLIVENGITKYDSCNMFDIDYNYLAKIANISTYKSDMNLTDLPIKLCDNGWTYDNSYYDETAVTALDLVCHRSHYISLILSVGSVGTIIGTPILGWFSDKIGRRKTFQITILICIISSISPIILRDLTSFITFRLINGLLLPSFYQLPFIILLETVGPRARTLINGVACLSWVVGLCILSLIAYLTRDWILISMVCSSTIFIFFFYWKLLPESPRWLLTNEKYAAAEILLEQMAKVNGRPKPENLMQKLKSVGKKLNTDQESEQVSNAIWVFLKNPGLRKNISLITLNWMSCAAVYFGIHLNLYNLSGNEFLNFFLLSIIEAPGYILGWYCIESRLGRRWSYSLSYLLCGLSLCMPAIIPDSLWMLANAMTYLGKFCGTISFMVIYQQAAEIYPTSIRNQGLGVGSMASSLVGIAMPYLTFSVSQVWIPLTILGLISIIVGLISTLLPETLNVNLPQTIEEGNIFGKNQKYFSWAETKVLTKNDNKLEIKPVIAMKPIEL